MVAFKPCLDGTLTIGADDILSSRPENLTGRDEPRWELVTMRISSHSKLLVRDFAFGTPTSQPNSKLLL